MFILKSDISADIGGSMWEIFYKKYIFMVDTLAALGRMYIYKNWQELQDYTHCYSKIKYILEIDELLS